MPACLVLLHSQGVELVVSTEEPLGGSDHLLGLLTRTAGKDAVHEENY